MTTVREEGAPILADLVNAGVKQTEAVPVNDFISMVHDISNAYLVTTADGDVLVNTGSANGAERNKAMFDKLRTGPLRKIIVTQSHFDHYGGVNLMREPGTELIVQDRFPFTREYYLRMAPYFRPRTNKLWAAVLAGQGGKPAEEPDLQIDRLVHERESFDVGGRTFDVISTPGGETIDSLTVWMPKEKVAFTGNLFGPVFLSMPFLCTVRGDKPRSVVRYLESLDLVRNLGAELLITGHGEPIRGAARVRADLDRMYKAVSYVNEQVIEGMNAGKSVHQLMREIRVPDDIAIGEYHGNVRWAVRTIFDEYTGWFLYDSTTSLYGVPRSSIDADLAELAGGADALAARAEARFAAGDTLQAIHLVDIALGAAPGNRPALTVKKKALEKLLDECGGTNLSETMWLKSEIAEVGDQLG